MRPLPTDNPVLSEVIRAIVRQELAQLRAANVARVLEYDETEQRATVQLVQRQWRLVDGVAEQYDAPPIPGVPVAWPSSSSQSLTFPLAAGDFGVVVFADQSLDEWLATGEPTNDSADRRRHAFNDAIFIPGVRPFRNPLPSEAVDSSAMVLRASEILLGDSTPGATAWVALAQGVLDRLQAIESAFNTHIHPAGSLLDSGGSPCTGTVGAGPTAGNSTLDAIRSQRVKAL